MLTSHFIKRYSTVFLKTIGFKMLLIKHIFLLLPRLLLVGTLWSPPGPTICRFSGLDFRVWDSFFGPAEVDISFFGPAEVGISFFGPAEVGISFFGSAWVGHCDWGMRFRCFSFFRRSNDVLKVKGTNSGESGSDRRIESSSPSLPSGS